MSIPVYISQVSLDGTDSIGVGSNVDNLADTYYYFLISNKTSTGNGMSYLTAFAARLTAANPGVTYSAVLDSNLKVKVTHDSGSLQGMTLDATTAKRLGYVAPNAAATAFTATFASTGQTATYRPQWLWCPEMPISMTGPVMFDPIYNYGVPSSPGSAQRSADQTASYVANGTTYAAEHRFNGVQPYYRAKPNITSHFNDDFETFWQMGPRLGRRILYWRDRTNVMNTTAASAGSSSPYNYVEYNPTDAFRAAPPMGPTSANPPNLVYWDISLPFWLTERGESVY